MIRPHNDVRFRIRPTRTRLLGGAVVTLAAVSALFALFAAPGVAAGGPTWVATQHSTGASAPGPMVFGGAAATTGGGHTVFYGGENPGSNQSNGATWLNTSGQWTAVCGTTVAGATAPCGPGTRSAMGMATGPHGVLVFGGFLGQFFGSSAGADTWQFNGDTWRQVCTTANCGPSARALPAMTGNGVRAVLYGGLDGSTGNPIADTWIYNTNGWHEICGAPLPTACAPGPLAGASLAWDGTQFVLFGGITTGGSTPVDDTWVLDGTTWVHKCGTSISKPCGPSGRVLGAFAYAHDNAGGLSGAVLAEGGNLFSNGSQTLYRDAWLWRNDAWTSLTVPWSGPPVVFTGSPPAGPDPLLGALASQPGSCQLVYLGTVAGSGVFTSKTFVFSRNRARETVPTTCAEAPPPVQTSSAASSPASASVSATVAHHTSPAASHPASAAATSAQVLPATGAQHVPGLLAIAAGLLVVGALALGMARWAGARGRRSRLH